MDTVREYCQVCRKMTTSTVTKITPGRTNRKEDIIALRCEVCERNCLRKVPHEKREEDA